MGRGVSKPLVPTSASVRRKSRPPSGAPQQLDELPLDDGLRLHLALAEDADDAVGLPVLAVLADDALAIGLARADGVLPPVLADARGVAAFRVRRGFEGAGGSIVAVSDMGGLSG